MQDTPSEPLLDHLISAAPDLAGLSIDPDAKAAVLANLRMALASAARIREVGYEAGPVFRA